MTTTKFKKRIGHFKRPLQDRHECELIIHGSNELDGIEPYDSVEGDGDVDDQGVS